MYWGCVGEKTHGVNTLSHAACTRTYKRRSLGLDVVSIAHSKSMLYGRTAPLRPPPLHAGAHVLHAPLIEHAVAAGSGACMPATAGEFRWQLAGAKVGVQPLCMLSDWRRERNCSLGRRSGHRQPMYVHAQLL